MYDVEVLVAPALAETVQEPYGVCLIIGPFNYPIQLMVSLYDYITSLLCN
jgi:acyl-CoA reductase-like NAD-dependent aldehyde dehydrogenase